MTESELSDICQRLSARFGQVPAVWISVVVDNAVDLIGRAGVVPTAREVESLAFGCLRVRATID